MSDRLMVGTRKGLLTFARNGNGWAIARSDFAGIPVSAVLHDRRNGASDGTLYAALNHGHFGAKLHRSADAHHLMRARAAAGRPGGRSGRVSAVSDRHPGGGRRDTVGPAVDRRAAGLPLPF